MIDTSRNDPAAARDIEIRLARQLREAVKGYNWLALLLTLVLGLLFYIHYRTESVFYWAGWLLLTEAGIAVSFLYPMSLPGWRRWYSVFFVLGCAGWSLAPVLFGLVDHFTPLTLNLYGIILLAIAATVQNPLSANRPLAMASIITLLAPLAAYQIYTLALDSLISGLTLVSIAVFGGTVLLLRTLSTHRAQYEAASLNERLDLAESELQENRSRLQSMESRQNDSWDWDNQTGLPSLTGFWKNLKKLPPTGTGTAINIRILDLEHINTAFGHDISDAIIADTARKLCAITRSGDLSCRAGSGSFLAFLPGRRIHRQMLLETLAIPTFTSVGKLQCPINVGLTTLLEGHDAAAAIKVAKSNALQARSLSGEKVAIIEGDSGDIKSVETQSRLNFDLPEAIENDALHLVYQPLHDARTGAVKGFEALARWEHPTLGNISPATFIPIAEESGQMIPLGNWVLDRALRDFIDTDMLAADISLSVNISPLQLTHAGFIDYLEEIRRKYRVPAGRINLEITESTFMDDPVFFVSIIDRARELGFRISLDDFGTGFSSLSCLTQFPIDHVKIDRSLIARIPGDEDADKLFGCIIYMCATLKLPVTVEGVETAEQLEAVRRHGAERIQGFYFSPGIRKEETAAYLQRQPQAAS